MCLSHLLKEVNNASSFLLVCAATPVCFYCTHLWNLPVHLDKRTASSHATEYAHTSGAGLDVIAGKTSLMQYKPKREHYAKPHQARCQTLNALLSRLLSPGSAAMTCQFATKVVYTHCTVQTEQHSRGAHSFWGGTGFGSPAHT